MMRACLAHCYAVAGKREQTEAILEQLRQDSPTSYVSSYDIAEIHIGLSEIEQAFTWLEKSRRENSRGCRAGLRGT